MAAEEEEICTEWSELIPTCLLEEISDRLISHGDYIRFGAVCNSWSCVFLDNVKHRPPHPQPPLLMIPLIHDEVVDGSSDISATTNTTSNKRSLYSVTEQMVCKFQVPVPDNVCCFGSSHGWLTTVAMDDDGYPVRLLNPFLPENCNEIELPSLRTMPVHESAPLWNCSYATKFVVSSSPATATATASATTIPDNYTVITMCGISRELLLWKPGDKSWTTIENENPQQSAIEDFIHCKDRYYAITWNGEVIVTVDNNSRTVHYAPPPPDTEQYCSKKYIVEASGDLYQVQRDVEDEDKNHHFTFNFEVFKLLDYEEIESGEDDAKMKQRSWKEVDTLEGHAFFIGCNASMSVLASEFPGCKPNCIYFSDDYMDIMFSNVSEEDEDIGAYTVTGESLNVLKHKDIGVYSLEDDSFTYNFDFKESSLWPNPIWIEPTICSRGSRS